MKKLIIFLIMLVVVSALFAEDLLMGTGYVIDEAGDAYTIWDLEVDIPVIELIDLDEDQGVVTLYYSYGYEPFIETVDVEVFDDYEYSSMVQFTFYSDMLGSVNVHISDEAEVKADGLYAMLGSYRIETEELGYLTYVCIIAAEYYQYEDEEIEEFLKYIEEVKAGYEEEIGGGK